MKINIVAPVHNNQMLGIPIGVSILSTILEKNHEVNLIDIDYLKVNNLLEGLNETNNERVQVIGDYILSNSPNIVTFSTMVNNILEFLSISKYIKSKNREIKIIFGGPQASLTAEPLIKKFDYIDFVCIGESETYVEEFVENIFDKERLKDIKGLVFRYKDTLVNTGHPTLIGNLELIPRINYENLPYIKDLKTIDIEVGRGCPFSCKFCSTKSFWKQNFRLRKLEDIIDEIEYFYMTYNKKNFSFVHDLFTLKKDRIIEFSKKLLNKNLDIEWSCSSRLDTLDFEMLKNMVDSGCSSIYFGIESGSDRMQKKISKRLKLDEIEKKLNDINRAKLKNSTFSFIYGFPEETVEDLKDTLNLMEKVWNKGFNHIQLSLCCVLAGTELYNQVKDDLYIDGKTFSSMAENNHFEDNKDLIENNKELFPHYFNYSTYVRDKYYDLSYFVEHFFDSFFQGSIHLLRKHYNFNLLGLFLDLKSVASNNFNDIFNYEKLNYLKNKFVVVNTIISEILSEYLSQFGYKLPSYITETFDYEYNLFMTYKLGHNYTNKFSFDVFSIRKSALNIDIRDIKEEKILINISKNKNKIKIEREIL